jgi:transmembrane sensor
MTVPMTARVFGNAPRDPDTVRQEAVSWYAHLCSGDATEQDKQQFERWCHAHADNQRAWERFEAMRQSFERVPARIGVQTLQVASKSRRRMMHNLSLLVSASAVTYVGYQFTLGSSTSPVVWLSDYRTRVGEQRRITLADGSNIVLNTDSAVDVAYDGITRLIQLRSGEILVETARHLRAPGYDDEKRPLVIATAHGQIRALGTRFNVRQFDDRTEVTVLDDAVEVAPAKAGGQHLVLTAGQRISFNDNTLFTVEQAQNQAAWTSGSLVVNDWALEDVIAELGRYRRGRLMCQPQVAGIRVSGAFPLHDTDRALIVLARSFPLKITSLTRFWVTVGALNS